MVAYRNIWRSTGSRRWRNIKKIRQVSNFWFIVLLIHGGHRSFLWGHWYPCAWLLVTYPLCFKARLVALFTFGGGVRVTRTLRFTSCTTPADLLVPAWQLSHSLPRICEQALVGLGIGIYCAAASQCETQLTFYRLSYKRLGSDLEFCNGCLRVNSHLRFIRRELLREPFAK